MHVGRSSRFKGVLFNAANTSRAHDARVAFENAEEVIERVLPNGSREKSLVLTHLEESFMFVGRAIRAEQLDPRNG